MRVCLFVYTVISLLSTNFLQRKLDEESQIANGHVVNRHIVNRYTMNSHAMNSHTVNSKPSEPNIQFTPPALQYQISNP